MSSYTGPLLRPYQTPAGGPAWLQGLNAEQIRPPPLSTVSARPSATASTRAHSNWQQAVVIDYSSLGAHNDSHAPLLRCWGEGHVPVEASARNHAAISHAAATAIKPSIGRWLPVARWLLECTVSSLEIKRSGASTFYADCI